MVKILLFKKFDKRKKRNAEITVADLEDIILEFRKRGTPLDDVTLICNSAPDTLLRAFNDIIKKDKIPS